MNVRSRMAIQYVICMGAFVSTLSAGMLNIALIDLADEFNQPIHSVQWVITIYLLVISVCLPLMGRLGDIKGKRKIHNFGIILFVIGSLCCALSSNLYILILFRVVQGIGASMFQATNMALIVSLFPPDRRGAALGVTGTFVAVGSMAGPGLGGIVLQWFDWQMNFWILTVIAFVVWMLAQYLIPKDEPSAEVDLDWTGAGFFGVSLAGLITALNMGSMWGWRSTPVLLLFAVFVVSAVCLLGWSRSKRWNQFGKSPFIQFGLFRLPRVRMGIATTIITQMAAFSTQLVLPVYLRTVLHVQPAVVGLMLLAYPAAIFIVAPVSGKLSDRIGSVPLIYAGLTGMVGSLAGLSFLSDHSSSIYVMTFTLILGCSMGMVNSPNNNLTFNNVPSQYLGIIGSMIALSRNIGMILGTVAGGTLMGMSFSGDLVKFLFPGNQNVIGFRAIFTLTSVMVSLIYALQLISSNRSRRKLALRGEEKIRFQSTES